jgi:hypothetical protein
MEESFDLLPFLRLRFGALLQPTLERVLILSSIPYTADGTTIEQMEAVALEFHRRGEDGEASVDLQDYCLGEYDPSRPFHEYVLEHLALDEYSWLMIGDIFRPEAAEEIAARHEAPLCESRLEKVHSQPT